MAHLTQIQARFEFYRRGLCAIGVLQLGAYVQHVCPFRNIYSLSMRLLLVDLQPRTLR